MPGVSGTFGHLIRMRVKPLDQTASRAIRVIYQVRWKGAPMPYPWFPAIAIYSMLLPASTLAQSMPATPSEDIAAGRDRVLEEGAATLKRMMAR